MKLVMLFLVRDEADIIDFNIQYHLSQGVDFFVATDNRSSDETTNILEKYNRKGLLHLINEPGDYIQEKLCSKMASIAYKDHKADWIISNDADEFWVPKDGSLKQVFMNVPFWCPAVVVNRFNFIPSKEENELFYNRLTIREKTSLNPRGNRRLPPKVAYRGRRNVSISVGNHKINGNRFKRILSKEISSIDILHFPFRSYEQYEKSVINKGTEWAKRQKHNMKGELLKLYKEGKLMDYYNNKILNEKEIEAGLKSGRFIIDDRIKNKLNSIQ